MRLKSLMINMGVLLASLFFILFLLEIFMRIFLPGPQNHQLMYTYHPQAGTQCVKNLDFEIDTGNGPVHIICNDYGYIGENYPAQKPTGEYRIAHFGDSYVEGVQMVDWDGTFVNLLSQKLNDRSDKFDNFRSLNFGIGGRGTLEEFYTYKYIALEQGPDLNILWVTMANDLSDNYLPITESQALANNDMGGIKYWLKKSALVSYIFEHLKDNLTFISVLHRLGLSNKIAYTGNEDIEDDKVAFDEKVNYSTKDNMFDIQMHSYQITQEILRNFQNLTQANGQEFLVVLIPETIRVCPELQDDFFGLYQASPADYDFDKADRAWKVILEQNKIKYIDLMDFVKEYQESGSYCGKLFDDHFSVCGHEQVAEYIANVVLEQYIETSRNFARTISNGN